VLAEFISASRHSPHPIYTHEESFGQVERLMRTFPGYDLTPVVVLEAERGAHDCSLSYYDAQIWPAARPNQTVFVFSEDFQQPDPGNCAVYQPISRGV
jgi:predicted nucleic acid-binding protein